MLTAKVSIDESFQAFRTMEECPWRLARRHYWQHASGMQDEDEKPWGFSHIKEVALLVLAFGVLLALFWLSWS